jgi:ATP-dependent Zn protease
MFLHVIDIQSPDELKRTAMLQWISRKCGISVSADLSRIAAQTSGFLYADLTALIFHAVR